MSTDNSSGPRLVSGVPTPNGRRYATNLTPTAFGPEVTLPWGKRRIIPVIFIPGIMGSRLKSKYKNKKSWDPPNPDSIKEVLTTFWDYLFKSSKKRKEELTPDEVEVDRGLKESAVPKGQEADAGSLAFRGWGSVYGFGYHRIMRELEKNLNVYEGLPFWSEAYASPFEYGGLAKDMPLTKEEHKTVAGYLYEVWGGGYNWLQSNEQSAADLQEYVEDTIIPHYQKRGDLNKAGKILVVTHSMGGLVARAMCREKNATWRDKRILGVIHTMQPAAGAPATYNHMRAGFKGMGRFLMGRNAADVTGVLGGAQGGLELLPFGNYNGGNTWLFGKEDLDGHAVKDFALPKGDPYGQIYLSSKWYSLVPPHNIRFLNPKVSPGEAWAQFAKFIDAVEVFHLSIINQYHPRTYAVWGEDSNMLAWGKIYWEPRRNWSNSRKEHWDRQLWERAATYPKDTGRGTVTYENYIATIQDEDAPGDGTVPDLSARDQKINGKLQGYFIHGDKNPRHIAGKPLKAGYEHTACCNDERVIWCVTYSAARLVVETLP